MSIDLAEHNNLWAIALDHSEAYWVSADGEVETHGFDESGQRLARRDCLICHRPSLARKLAQPIPQAYDLLELFAFVRPAQFCRPTIAGLADALAQPKPADPADEALFLHQAAAILLAEFKEWVTITRDDQLAGLANTMASAGWNWGASIVAVTGAPKSRQRPMQGLDVWNRLAEWEERPPRPPPGVHPVSAAEARAQLQQLLGPQSEQRSAQADYAALSAAAFQARDQAGAPWLVLAEAGTGIGKTAGYLAAAQVWTQQNKGTVWLSTYTKNLQRQVDQELDRLYPDPGEKRQHVTIRKGRENFLCLLNFEELVKSASGRPTLIAALGLLARWIQHSRNGDMVGGDFPAWLGDIFVRQQAGGQRLNLTDRRGECIYSACPHYRKCFIEHSIREARQADMVIANHALLISNAALLDDDMMPSHIVFDEGHHIFDAADNAFSAHLSGREGRELRRWLLGHESGSRSGRARGLEARIGDLIDDDEAALEQLQSALQAARQLPSEGWLQRICNSDGKGVAEVFLAHVHQQVLARAEQRSNQYSLETDTGAAIPGLLQASRKLAEALHRLRTPLRKLIVALNRRLDDEAENLDTPTRIRIESAIRALMRRESGMVASWIAMLEGLGEASLVSASDEETEMVDWLAIERIEARAIDVGMHRHWVDPSIPFAQTVLARAQGVLLTSATLKDSEIAETDSWQAAEIRSGASHLPLPAIRGHFESPFDFANNSQVLIVNDLRRHDSAQIAAAYRALFVAAGGGSLGLFTAIQRLRAVHAQLQTALAEKGLALWAQHVDAIDTATLVDIFRADTNACLLGTDAIRDGVDVPGPSLRQIVFDRVPWARPSLLHRARRTRFGGSRYDDFLARLRLKQAFGRLLRRQDDRGVFVLLDAMTPSRLLSAFPRNTPVHRVGLKEAVARVQDFLTADV